MYILKLMSKNDCVLTETWGDIACFTLSGVVRIEHHVWPRVTEGWHRKRISVNALFTCATLFFCESGCIAIIVDLRNAFDTLTLWRAVPQNTQSLSRIHKAWQPRLSSSIARQPKTECFGGDVFPFACLPTDLRKVEDLFWMRLEMRLFFFFF